MELDLRTPDGSLLQTTVRAVKARDASGGFTLLPAHASFLTALEPCILTYRPAEGSESHIAVDGGLLIVEGGTVTVVTRDAVPAESVETAGDAVAAMVENRQRQEAEASRAFSDLAASLIRELPILGASR
jgi:F-type H+-transporting ATPase subunit epsilon